MANPFDRFDVAANPFDQFDAPPRPARRASVANPFGIDLSEPELLPPDVTDVGTELRAAWPGLKQTLQNAMRDPVATVAGPLGAALDLPGTVAALRRGEDPIGDTSRAVADSIQATADASGAERQAIRAGLSPEAQALDQDIARTYQDEGFLSGFMKQLRNPSSIARLVAGSAPATGAAVLAGRFGARGVMGATVPMGAGEAISGLRDEILQANPFDLLESPIYRETLERTGDDRAAREALFESVRDTAGMVGAGAGTIPGLPGLNPVEQVLSRQASSTAARGALGRFMQTRAGRAAREAIGEVPEEVGINLGSNLAQAEGGLDVDPFEGTAQAAGGAILAGGVMGAATPGQQPAQPVRDGADLLGGGDTRGALAEAMRRQAERSAGAGAVPGAAPPAAAPAAPGAQPSAPDPALDDLLTRNVPPPAEGQGNAPAAALPSGLPEETAAGQIPLAPVDAAAAAAATSPANALPEPTDAQKEAGNYQKGHVRLAGLDVSIENPAGSTRSGTSPDGRQWSNTMQAHYGYIRGTTGADGDHIDAFIRPGFEGDPAAPVFVIDQVDPETGRFDEAKVMLGYGTEREARDAYLSNYEADWQGFGGMRRMGLDEFKEWSKRPRLSRQAVSVAGRQSRAWRQDLEKVDDLPPATKEGLAQRFERATRVLPTYEADLSEIAASIGGRAIVAPLKGVARASAKVKSDYGGDATRITDLVRGTIELPDVASANAALERLIERYGQPVKLKNNLDPTRPPPFANGYRDINAVFLVDGEPSEIQVNVPEMLVAKDKAHKLYEEYEAIRRRAVDEGRDSTDAEKAELKRLDAAQAAIYLPAWEAAMARSPASSESTSSRWTASGEAPASSAATSRSNSSGEVSWASSRNRPNVSRSDERSQEAVLPIAVAGTPSMNPNIVPSGNPAGGEAGARSGAFTTASVAPAPAGEWVSFDVDSGTLGIPRGQMPQVKGKDRQAYMEHLERSGIRGEPDEVDAASLKPTQAEYSRVKAQQFARTGPVGERRVLISSDGYVLDGHHQWMGSKMAGLRIPVLRMNAPIRELLAATNAFPGVQRSAGAEGMSVIATGNAGTAYTASNEAIPFRYALVDDAALVASNEPDGRVNPSYPAEMQPRDRSTPESRAQVAAIAGNLVPERLGESGDIVNGAPLVGPDGVVESGNGRVMALRQAPAERLAAYKQWLVENAERFGLEPARVERAEAPRLVRLRQGEMSMAERARLGREGNRGTQQAMNPIEVARADARVLDDGMMDLFDPGEDGNVLVASNQPFLLAFARELGGMEAAGLSAGGRWTKQMADRVNAAVFYRAYGDDRLLAAFAAEADPDMKNILAALGRAAKEFALARSAGAADQGLDAGALLAGAVQILSDARSRGQALQEYLAQGSLLGDGPAGAEAAMATWLASNARAHRRISDTLTELGRDIRAELASRQSGDMFGRSDRSLPEMVDGRVQQQAGVREPGAQPYRADERGDLPGELEGAGGADARAVPGFQLAGQSAPAGRVAPARASQGGLFAPPTRDEVFGAERQRRDDELNARGRRAVPMIEGEGELFAGPRPAQADIESATLPEDDRASYGTTRPLQGAGATGEAADPSVAEPRRRAAAAVPGQLDLFVVHRGGEPAAFPRQAKLRNHAALVTTGKLTTGIRQVRSWQDAAHVLAPIRKLPQEQLTALVLNGQGEPLAVIRHSLGTVDSASVESWSLVGAVSAIPGARQVYFGHNHPGGDSGPSNADRSAQARLDNLLEDSGIASMGHVVVAPGSRTAHFIPPRKWGGYVSVESAQIKAAPRRTGIDVRERVLRRVGSAAGRRPIASQNDLTFHLDQHPDLVSGLVLLDARHRVVGIIPVPVAEMYELRTKNPETGVASILRAVAQGNGSAAAVFAPKAHSGAALNLATMLHEADVRVLDAILGEKGSRESAAVRGLPLTGQGFLSRGTRPTLENLRNPDSTAPGVRVERVREMVDRITANWTGDAPRVEVLATAEGLPAWVKSDPDYRLAEGFYDQRTGTVYLVAPNLTSLAHARRVLAHEVVGHHGIEAIAGPETWSWVKGHVERMRRDGRHAALFADIDSRYAPDDPAYLREVVAVMAERGVGVTLLDRLAAAVRRFLASLGLTAPASEDAVRQLIVRAARQVRTGPATEGTGDLSPAGAWSRGRDDAALFSRPAGQRQHSKAQLAFLAKAGLRPDTRTWLQRVRDRASEQTKMLVDAIRDGDAARQAIVDRFHGIRAAYETAGETRIDRMDGYVSARLSTGLPAVMESVMMHGAPEWRDGVLSVKPGTRGLLTALGPVKDSIDDWLGWMVARRAQVLKDQGREKLMSDADIAAGLSLAAGREAAFRQAALDYLTLKNAVLDVAEQAGLIDPQKRAVWDHAEYIPFYRDDVDSIGPGTRQGLAGQSSGIRTLRGGDTALADPLGNIVRNFTRLIDASLKNRAMLEVQGDLGEAFFEKLPATEFKAATVPLEQVRKHLVEAGVPQDAVDAMPQAALQGFAKFWAVEPPVADDVVRIFRDGRAEYYRVEDPLLLRSLTAFKPRMPGWFMKPLIWAKRVLTAGATGTAEFVGANFIRDSLEGWMVADDRLRPVVDSMRGALAALKSDERTRELMMAGAYFAHGQIYGHDPDATAAALRRSLRSHGVANKDLESFIGTIARGPAWLWDRWTYVQSGVEHGTRRALQDAALAAGKSRKQAAFEAKDLLDFSMRGDSEFIAFFTDVVPFLNARLQGLYKLGRSAHRNRRQMAMRGGTLATATLALLAWNLIAHQEGYDELEEWDRDMYWHIGPGTAYHVRIPKPFELGLVFGTAPERGARALLNLAGSEAGDSARQTWQAVLHALSETLAVNPVPQALAPIVEQVANRSFFTGRPIENLSDQKLLPEARAEWYTSATMKLAPGWLSNATGMSPKRLEHLWRGYTAGLGGYALAMSDWLVRRAQDEPWRPGMHLRDVPLVGRFARGDAPPRSTSYQTEFYRLKQRAEQIEGTIKEYLVRAAAEGRADLRERALELHQANIDLLGPSQARRGAKAGVSFGVPTHLRRVQDYLGTLRAREERIVQDRTLSPAEKRDQIDAIVAERNEALRRTVLLLRGQSPQNPNSDPN